MTEQTTTIYEYDPAHIAQMAETRRAFERMASRIVEFQEGTQTATRHMITDVDTSAWPTVTISARKAE